MLIVANLAICVHMLSAFQVFAQPIFDSIESQIKAVIIKRQLRARAKRGAQPEAAAQPDGGQAPASHAHSSPHTLRPSPFSTTPEDSSAERASEAGKSLAACDPAGLEEGAALGGRALSSALGSRQMSARVSGSGMQVLNSEPIPDLVPLSGKPAAGGSRRMGCEPGCHMTGPPPAKPEAWPARH